MADRDFTEGLADLERGPAVGGDDGAPVGRPADAGSHQTVAALRTRFGDAIQYHTVMAGDEHVVYIAAAKVVEALAWLKSETTEAYDFLADLTAVDYGGGRPLEVVYQLWSMAHKRSLRVKASLPLDALEIDSAYAIWRAADWLERETFDLFGIHFRGHPDLRRIMMPENYAEGHPLRKDFPLRGRFSRAEQTRRALAMDVEDYYIPTELDVAAEDRDAASARNAWHSPVPESVPVPDPERAGSGPKQADDWSFGTEGSAASGAPGPSGASE
jgi:NADH-quinone oxidoreductase subunit C